MSRRALLVCFALAAAICAHFLLQPAPISHVRAPHVVTAAAQCAPDVPKLEPQLQQSPLVQAGELGLFLEALDLWPIPRGEGMTGKKIKLVVTNTGKEIIEMRQFDLAHAILTNAAGEQIEAQRAIFDTWPVPFVSLGTFQSELIRVRPGEKRILSLRATLRWSGDQLTLCIDPENGCTWTFSGLKAGRYGLSLVCKKLADEPTAAEIVKAAANPLQTAALNIQLLPASALAAAGGVEPERYTVPETRRTDYWEAYQNSDPVNGVDLEF